LEWTDHLHLLSQWQQGSPPPQPATR
jgi:hypothetical protein